MFDRNKNESEDNIMKKRIMMLLGGLAVVSAIAISKPSMAAAVSKEEVDVRVDNESKKAEVLNGLYENSGCVKLTQAEIEKMSKMEKMESITLQGISIEKLDMSKAKKLKTLVLDNCDTKSLKVTKNKKLTKIVIRNTKIKTLDLSQNQELTEVAVQNGEESYLTNLKTGKMEEKTFFKFPEQSCKVKFAAKNKIKKLEYYAANKQIDLSQLTALRELSITKDTSVKVSKKWYKKTKKKLKVYSEGFLQKKLKVKNSGNMITLKPTKSKDVSYGYKMMEDYSVY